MGLRPTARSFARLTAWAVGLLAHGLAVACASPVSGEGATMSTTERREAKVLMMHYMPWFETPSVRGRWGEHWTGWEKQHDPEAVNKDGLPDIFAKYHPLIGLYDSTDRAVLECQLLQMKLAGIDGVIPDWYGLTDAADYATIHEGTRALVDECERLGMKFAVSFEDRTFEYQIGVGLLKPEGVVGQLAATLEWLGANWFASENYLRVGGKPLFMVFGPISLTEPEAWAEAFERSGERPAFYGLHHLWKNAGGDGGFTWVHPKAWEGDPTREQVEANLRHEFLYTSKVPGQIIVSAVPGFDDAYKNSYPAVPYRGGETMRESLGVCMDGDWPIVQLVTWNDYGEGTMIEPTHEFGYTFLEIIQEARRAELGEAFGFTAEDLRLPARLLELRRKGTVDEAKLDRIAALLRDGSCGEAQGLIEAAEMD